MKLLGLCALVVSACVPNATGGGCAPVSCGSSQVTLAHGNLLAIKSGSQGPLRVVDLRTGATRWRLPAGVLGANLLVHQKGTRLTWFNAATGARVAGMVARTRDRFVLTGASQDGARAVLVSRQKRTITFLIASRTTQRRVVLPKNSWDFDALSGSKLYLLQYVRQGYVVRLFDLATNKLAPHPLKDQEEAAVIVGAPWVRATSPNGRYVFTVYISGAGRAMVHQLDVRAGIAKCIDLPGGGNFNAATTYSLTSSSDGRTLWAVATGYGKAVAIDVAGSRVRRAFDFAPAVPAKPSSAAVAVSTNGDRLAVANGGRLWFMNVAEQRVIDSQSRVAIALGFSPDGMKLWTLGERSRIIAVPVP